MRKRLCKRYFSAILVLALIFSILPCSALQVFATDGSFVQETGTALNSGMTGIDLSEEGVAAAQISREEFMQRYGLSAETLALSEEKMYAECFPVDAQTSVSVNSVSDNGIVAEGASYLTLEDAATYLRKKMVQREELVTIKIGTTKVSALKSVEKIMNKAVEYDINGKPEEGDYLYWHISRFTWPRELDIKNGTITIPIGIEYLTSEDEEAYVTKKVNSVVKKLGLTSSSKTEYEKVRLIYDYVMKLITYDDYHYNSGEPYPYMHSAYAAFDTGYAVCQSYATVFYRLCEEAGISARVIPGNPNEKGSSTHGWNIVKIGNDYYNLDATWDDSANPTHIYFLKNKAEFAGHTRQSDFASKSFEKAFPTALKSYPLPDENEDAKLIRFTNTSGEIMMTDGTYFSVTSTGRPKILFFFDPSDSSSGLMLNLFYANKLGESGCDVAVIDICDYSVYGSSVSPGAILESIMSYAGDRSRYQYGSDYFNAEERNGYYYRNIYAMMAGKSLERSSLIAVIDGADQVRYVGTGIQMFSQLSEVVQRMQTTTYGTVKNVKLSQKKNNQVKVTWSAYKGADSYLVYRKTGSGSYYCLGSVKGTSFTDNVKPKKKYTYQLYAVKGEIDIACSSKKTIKTVTKLLKKGKTYTVGNYKYKVLTSSSKSKTVAFAGVSNKKLTSVVIPAGVEIDGLTYKVTEIAENALKGNKKVKNVTIGSNVTKIGKKAFSGAKKLSLIVVKSKKIKKVGSKSLSGIASKAEIRVPSSKVKSYKKLFSSKGQKKTVKIKKA